MPKVNFRSSPVAVAPRVLKVTAEEQLAMVGDGFVTVAEAAAFLGLAKSTIYALMESGSLPFAKFNRARRIPRIALLKYAASNVYS